MVDLKISELDVGVGISGIDVFPFASIGSTLTKKVTFDNFESALVISGAYVVTSGALVTDIANLVTVSGAGVSVSGAGATHQADNTQAHSDYLLNSAADIGVGLQLTGDNVSADTTYVPNVLYNTDATPPTASTVPIGTIYVQYTA